MFYTPSYTPTTCACKVHFQASVETYVKIEVFYNLDLSWTHTSRNWQPLVNLQCLKPHIDTPYLPSHNICSFLNLLRLSLTNSGDCQWTQYCEDGMMAEGDVGRAHV